MQTQNIEVKPKTRIVAFKIYCEVCNLSQHQRSHAMYSLPDTAGFEQTQTQVRVSRTSNASPRCFRG